MRKCVIILFLLISCVLPVHGEAFTAPPVPDSAEVLVPEQPETFSEGLTTVLREAVDYLYPAFRSALGSCIGIIAAVLLGALVENLPGSTQKVTGIVATVSVALLLISPSDTLIQLGADTVREISEYGKLLLPVMTAAVAAQGGVSTSAALYTGTAFFNALLSGLIASVIVPMLYIFLCLAVASCATGEEILGKLLCFVKWAMTWCLKIILYVFTGYMGITGVISGTTDAAAMKATKLTISGMVPVVGGILSDASEAVLVTVGLAKSAIGVYGVVVIIALWIRPFIQIGIQYLMLKLTAGICGIFGGKAPVKLIESFSGAMGFLLGMTGAVSVLLMVSVVCLMRGIG
jgi:stage III sporulation protein AE